jgi:hypothetical protein
MIDESAPLSSAPAEAPTVESAEPAAPSAPPTAPSAGAAREELVTYPPPRQRWPLLGPTLCTFGAATWSYVAMGELATTYAPFVHGFLVGEGVAVLFVLATTFGAWWFALRASLAAAPSRSTARSIARGAGTAFLAFLSWCFVMFVVSAFGQSSHKNLDGKITVFLLLVAGGGTLGGRWLAGFDAYDESPREKTASRVLWIGVAVITLIALVAVVAD